MTTLKLGYSGENLARSVTFDVGDILFLFGDTGAFTLTHKRPGDTESYTVPAAQVTLSGSELTWQVKAYDVAESGYGECQLSYTVGSSIVKTERYRTYIQRSVAAGDPPATVSTFTIRFVNADYGVSHDNVYQIPEGGTWGAFCDSAYNPLRDFSGETPMLQYGPGPEGLRWNEDRYVLDENGDYVFESTEIPADAVYTVTISNE